MSGKLSKKNIIAIAIVVVLAIVAIIGTVVFLKDKGTTEATEISSESGTNGSGSETANGEAENNQQTNNNQEQNNNQETNNQEKNNQETNNQETNNQEQSTRETANNNQQRTTNTTTQRNQNNNNTQNNLNSNNNQTTNTNNNTNTGIDNIQGTTITRVTEGDLVKVSDYRNVGWTPIAINAELESAKINGERNSDITINKKATTKTGTNLVQSGEEIIYTLEIKNNGKEDFKGIEVSDSIPENTTYVETEDNSVKIKENDQVIGLKWYIDIKAGETVGVQFTVKVNEQAKGTISNIAISNGTPSEEIKTAIIKQTKTSTINRQNEEKWITTNGPAKINDRITYTITIKNTGDIEGKTTVKDKDLEEILADNKAEMIENVSILKGDEIVSTDKTSQDLIKGIKDVEVPAQGEAKVVFTVKVNKINGVIKNVALIGDDEEKPTDPEIIDTINITGKKTNTPEKEVKEDDTITYTIQLSNSGSKEGETIVTDKLSKYVELIKGTIKINGATTKYEQADLENGIKVKVPVGENTAKISFNVKVKALDEEKVIIKNVAYVDGNKTTEVENEAEKLKVSLTVNKTWNDDEVQAKRRPQTITFQLTANNEDVEGKLETVETVGITEHTQTVKFDNLNKYDSNGKKIIYGIKETKLNEFYKVNSTNTSTDKFGNITVKIENKFTIPENNTKEITITKIWEDENNKAGKRPESVNFTIVGSPKVQEPFEEILKGKNDVEKWQKTINVTKYDSEGEEIQYFAEEKQTGSIFYKIVDEDSKDLTITNKFEVPKTKVELTVNKKWDDNEIQAQKRPQTITFQLMANKQEVKGKTQTVNTANKQEKHQTIKFESLNKYDENGNAIIYDVKELEDSTFYKSTKKTPEVDNNGNITVEVENKFTIPSNNKTEIKTTKIWDDKEAQEKHRTDVEFKITGTRTDGENPITENVTIKKPLIIGNTKNKWHKTIEVQKYDNNGQEIQYSAEETTVPKFYEVKYDENDPLTITNKFIGSKETISITVKKEWNDQNNEAQKRPENVTLQLYNGDQKITDIELTENEWSTKINLPKYNKNGDIINYTIKEPEQNKTKNPNWKFYKQDEAKTQQPTIDNGYVASITNGFKVPDEEIKVDVIKKWDDKKTQSPKRPDKITFTLQKDNTEIGKRELQVNKELNEQEAESFTGLKRYDDKGNEIEYRVKETFTSEFYQQKNDAIVNKDENGNIKIEFTNEFKLPENNTRKITIKKIWQDTKEQMSKRPIDITATITGGKYVNKDIKISGEIDKWQKEIEVRNYDDNGDKIEYIIGEKELNKYYKLSKIEQPTAQNNYIATITNKFEVPADKKEIEISKTWKDNKKEHGNVEAQIVGKVKNIDVNTGIENQILNEENEWHRKIEVPVYDKNADLITYQVREVNIPDGYVTTYNQDKLEIINTLPSIKVTKTVESVNGEEIDKGTIPEVKVGDIVAYKITVKNTSDIELYNVTVTDDRKISLSLEDIENEENFTNNVGTISRLGVKDSETSRKDFIVYYKVKPEDTSVARNEIINTATATGNYQDSNGKNKTVENSNTAEITAKAIDNIKILKQQFINTSTTPASNGTQVKENDKINYKITVTNTGNTTLTGVTITDEMTNNMGTIQISEADKNIGTLAPKQSKTIQAKYDTVRADFGEVSKDIINTATVNAKNEQGNAMEPKSSSVKVSTITGKAQFTAQKSSVLTKTNKEHDKNIAEYGDTIKYSITVTNNGNLSGTTTVKDKVPEGTTLLTTGTNLKPAELEQLKSETGLIKDIELKAGGSYTITFTVKVTGTPGSKITNTADYKKEENTNTFDNVKDPKTHPVEKEVKLTKKSEKTINSNVVLVIDVSGSMAENDRLSNAKVAAKKLIKGIDFESGGQIGIVTFSSNGNSDNAKYLNISSNTKNYATSSADVKELEDKVDGLKAYGGTRIADGLVKAKSLIEEMSRKKPKNNNIVIVLSDGDYSVGRYDKNTLKSSAGETVSRVTQKATALKQSNAKPKIYSIAIVSNEEQTPGNTNIMTEVIPSDPKNYIKATDGYQNIIDAFKKVESEIGKDVVENKLSSEGKIELTNLKLGSTVVIKVNGKAITNVDSHLKTEKGKTYLDLSTFNADAKIEIEYKTN